MVNWTPLFLGSCKATLYHPKILLQKLPTPCATFATNLPIGLFCAGRRMILRSNPRTRQGDARLGPIRGDARVWLMRVDARLRLMGRDARFRPMRGVARFRPVRGDALLQAVNTMRNIAVLGSKLSRLIRRSHPPARFLVKSDCGSITRLSHLVMSG